MSQRPEYALALHGGAGVRPGRDYAPVEAHLRGLIAAGEAMLKDGASALDTVEEMTRQLEVSGMYVAGRGASPNAAGYVELDASIMDGARRKGGGVAAVRDLVSPINAARTVLEASACVLLVGQGADEFCKQAGLARVEDPASWYRLPVGVQACEASQSELYHGTVGAVAMDRGGRLASATSTGGVFGKPAGRVGDTPLIGSGTWADDQVAVSCTGLGEMFILAAVAHDIAARMRYGGQTLATACDEALAQVKALGGDGGVIAINARGEIALPFNSGGMKRASVIAGQATQVAIT
jgi:L-asparaginase / beta-aspartyl-peptidase